MKEFVSDGLWVLNLIGANPLNRSKIRIATALAIYCISMIPLIFDLVFNWKGTSSFESFSDLIAMTQVFFKILIVLVNGDKFAKLLHVLNDFWPSDKFGGRVQDELAVSRTSMRKFLRLLKISYLVMICTYICKPVFVGSKTLIVQWYLFSIDVYASPLFELSYLELTLSASAGIIMMMGCDILFLSLIFHVVCQLRLIKEGFASVSIDPATAKYDKKSQHEFNTVANHHCNMLKFAKDLNDNYSILFLLQFLTSTFCMCASLLLLTIDGKFSNPGECIKNLVYLTTFVGQMFLFCAAGSYIREESEDVARAVYDMEWWIKTQPKLRKAIVLVTLRSQRASALNGGGFFTMDLKCFTIIVRTGFSFYTLIQAVMNNRE